MKLPFVMGALTAAALSCGQSFAQTPASNGPPPARVLTVADATPDARGVKRMVVLRGLDKVTGRAIDINAPAGVPVNFGTLIMTARYCYTVPPEEPPETTAFLQIDEANRGEPAKRLFSGWMFASTPALNALEHSVYDVWVITCKTDEPAPPVAAAATPSAGAVKPPFARESAPAKPAGPPASAPASGAAPEGPKE
jgi:hypothetical protein